LSGADVGTSLLNIGGWCTGIFPSVPVDDAVDDRLASGAADAGVGFVGCAGSGPQFGGSFCCIGADFFSALGELAVAGELWLGTGLVFFGCNGRSGSGRSNCPGDGFQLGLIALLPKIVSSLSGPGPRLDIPFPEPTESELELSLEPSFWP